MIGLVKDYMEQRLKEANCKGQIYKTFKDLEISKAMYLGAILFEKEKFEADNTKIVHKIGAQKQIREKVLSRRLMMSVVIGAASQEEVEQISNLFIISLGRGINDLEGNYIEINILDADWLFDKESILMSKVAVQYKIEFIGGVYKKKNTLKITPGHIGVNPNLGGE